MSKSLLKILFGVVAGLFLALLFRCGPRENQASVETTTVFVTDTITKRDTVIREVIGPDRLVYIPFATSVTEEDSSSTYNFKIDEKDLQGIISVDSECEVKNFKANYNVTSTEKTITDTVIVNNSTTKTITKTIPSRNRVNLLVGSSLDFNPEGIQGVGFNAAFKTRRDFIIEAGYNYNFGLSNSYELGVKIPLLHQKK